MQIDHTRYYNAAMQYYERLYWTAYAQLRNEEDARDAVQEAIVKGAHRLHSFRGEAQLSTWLTTILINYIRDEQRKAARRREKALEESPVEYSDTRETPEKKTERNDTAERLMNTVNQLDENLRQLVYLRYFSALKIEEISKILDINPGTVKSRLNQARRVLRAELEKVGIGGDSFELQ